jgi:hypothetical protein
MSLGFILSASNQLRAAEFNMSNIRKFYPNSSYIILVDKGKDYYDLAKKYNAEILYCQKKNGYPVQPNGYQKEQILEFLQRMYIGCLRCTEEYVMLVEEDVYITKEITIPENTIVAGFNTTIGNDYPQKFIDLITNWSGIEPKFKKYGACGGTIFHRLTFVNNYDRMCTFIKINLDEVFTYYPTAGWIDCFMSYLFQVIGYYYTPNVKLFNIYPHLKKIPEGTEIVGNYKGYYD